MQNFSEITTQYPYGVVAEESAVEGIATEAYNKQEQNSPRPTTSLQSAGPSEGTILGTHIPPTNVCRQAAL